MEPELSLSAENAGLPLRLESKGEALDAAAAGRIRGGARAEPEGAIGGAPGRRGGVARARAGVEEKKGWRGPAKKRGAVLFFSGGPARSRSARRWPAGFYG